MNENGPDFFCSGRQEQKDEMPFCGRDNTRVIDSRPSDDNNAIRRRRVCDVCGKRFTTYEKVETIPLIVIKKITTGSPTTVPRSKPACCVPVISVRSAQTRSQG